MLCNAFPTARLCHSSLCVYQMGGDVVDHVVIFQLVVYDGASAFPLSTSWKAEDIGLFTPDPTQHRHIRSVRGATYCSSVYVFLNQLRSADPYVVLLRSSDTSGFLCALVSSSIPAVLPVSYVLSFLAPFQRWRVSEQTFNLALRGEAYEWYNSELSDIERAGLWTYTVDHEFGWFARSR